MLYIKYLTCTLVLFLFSATTGHTQALSDPLHDDGFIIEWSKKKIEQIFTLSHEDYQTDLRSNRLLFTQEGYPQYLNSLKRSHILNQLDLKEAKMQPIFLKEPQVCMQDLSTGNEVLWAVTTPISLKYKREDTTGEYITPAYKFTMILVRSNGVAYPDKIAINRIGFAHEPMEDINIDFCKMDNMNREIALFLSHMPKDVLESIKTQINYYTLAHGTDEDFSICKLIDSMTESLKERVSKHYNMARCELQRTATQ